MWRVSSSGFASGLEVYDCMLHVAGSRAWVSPPGMPKLDRDRRQILNSKGRPDYGIVIGFGGNHGVGSRWSREIITAVRRQYPSLSIPTEDEQQEELGREFWGDRR
jgi:hypothetical protein